MAFLIIQSTGLLMSNIPPRKNKGLDLGNSQLFKLSRDHFLPRWDRSGTCLLSCFGVCKYCLFLYRAYNKPLQGFWIIMECHMGFWLLLSYLVLLCGSSSCCLLRLIEMLQKNGGSNLKFNTPEEMDGGKTIRLPFEMVTFSEPMFDLRGVEPEHDPQN